MGLHQHCVKLLQILDISKITLSGRGVGEELGLLGSVFGNAKIWAKSHDGFNVLSKNVFKPGIFKINKDPFHGRWGAKLQEL